MIDDLKKLYVIERTENNSIKFYSVDVESVEDNGTILLKEKLFNKYSLITKDWINDDEHSYHFITDTFNYDVLEEQMKKFFIINTFEISEQLKENTKSYENNIGTLVRLRRERG